MSPRCRGELGSASVLAVGIASVSIVCVAATGTIGYATALRAGLAAAADAAALAGADALAGFVADDPCTVAARAAELNAARLEGCTVSGSDVAVVVVTTVLGVTVTSRARAGPPPG